MGSEVVADVVAVSKAAKKQLAVLWTVLAAANSCSAESDLFSWSKDSTGAFLFGLFTKWFLI